jgi:transcriptional regulator with XRE-family HTH domain
MRTPWELELGARLKRLRLERRLSQGQLAKMSGIPKGTVIQWEYGLRVPLLEAAAKLADALEVSLDELVGRPTPVRKQGPLIPKSEQTLRPTPHMIRNRPQPGVDEGTYLPPEERLEKARANLQPPAQAGQPRRRGKGRK